MLCSPDDPEDRHIVAKGLKKMDSLDYNRARLSQNKSTPGSPGLLALRDIEHSDSVEAVIDANIHMSAKSVLKGLVKQVTAEVVKQVEVVSAKYALETGKLEVMKRGWFSGQNIYFQ